MYRSGNRKAALPDSYGPHATDCTRWPVVLPGADFSAVNGMSDGNANVLELAAILGEAIARAHLAGKQAETGNEASRPLNAEADRATFFLSQKKRQPMRS